MVRVSVVLRRTVVGDWRFDNPSRSHLQSQVAKMTNHFQRTKLTTSLTDKHYSLDFEDDFRSGCGNVSNQPQFFSELPSPGLSHYTNDWYPCVQTIYYNSKNAIQEITSCASSQPPKTESYITADWSSKTCRTSKQNFPPRSAQINVTVSMKYFSGRFGDSYRRPGDSFCIQETVR